jgi:hypothetical protein
MVQKAGHKLKLGIDSKFQKFFSLPMVVILLYFQAAPESVKEKPFYREQLKLLEEAVLDLREDKDLDPNLFNKFLNILTVEASRAPVTSSKTKTSSKSQEPKPQTHVVRSIAHMAQEIDEETFERFRQFEAFVAQGQADQHRSQKSPHSSSTSQTRYPSGGGDKSKRGGESKRETESKNRDSGHRARSPSNPIPSWVHRELRPCTHDPSLSSTMSEGQPLFKGPVSRSSNVWIKIRSLIVPYSATVEPCRDCSHSPKCWVQERGCKNCGYFGHTKCLNKKA